MSTLDKTIAKIHANYGHDFACDNPEILRAQKSADGTVKFLFGLHDQNRVESVIMPYARRHTVCLSTQAGCAMGCAFCKTGSMGLARSLSWHEIAGQYLSCWRYLMEANPDRTVASPNIVFMGQGEPLHNFDAVKTACGVLLSEKGVCLGPRQITLSTVGYTPGLERISELPPVNFALSLHSAIPEKRAVLIPLEKTSGLDRIIPLLAGIRLKRNQFINFEYLLIGDFNDGEDDAAALAALTRRFSSIVNIIPFNEIAGMRWKRPGEERVAAFKAMLVARKVRTMVRNSRGRDISAACGQLAGE
ncbi:MAG TPA: 23S rRNA (adenine(2503)-C(2))-methyltransferase RlmN [Spirochaetota bacterium]|nr:23S rRNA (adenine(2503)-C(2))-methyltransferase RlmN [Spirochaetota bacterium]HSA16014.1 23S rRNA (adenine(2503)-C(2))-methyltransferase RlmN [Spirochaetota bacterium]